MPGTEVRLGHLVVGATATTAQRPRIRPLLAERDLVDVAARILAVVRPAR